LSWVRHLAAVLQRSSFVILALLLGAAALGRLPAAQANSLCVNQGGTGCYGTIAEAVTAAASGDTIHIAAGAPYLERLSLTKSVSLTGDGPAATIIDGNALGQVIRITSPITVSLSNLTIRNGRSSAADITDGAGAGIHNQYGRLTLNNVVVTDNHTGSGNSVEGGLGGGLAIINGQTTLNDSLVTDNTTGTPIGSPVGGAGGAGAGFYSDSSELILNRTTVSHNFAGAGGSSSGGNGPGGSGGGIAIIGGTLVLNNSSVTDNASGSGASGGGLGGNGGDGGGIYSNGATVSVDHSLISFNGAGLGGGAGDLRGYSGSGAGLFADAGGPTQLTITTSTISDNQTGLGLAVGMGGDGGGVWVGFGVTARLVNVTLAYNSADSGQTGGGLANHGGSLSLKNSLLANNGTNDDPPILEDCSGGLTSLDYNVLMAPHCSISQATNDHFFVSGPVVNVLADNGGPTQTNALPPGSPAIDKADNHTCSPTDQRGFARPAFGGAALRCDVGAFELYRFGSSLPLVAR
jgi:hypothetical protein